MPCPRAALFDIDETLAPSYQPIAPEMRSLLLQLLDRIPLALVTGRGFDRIGEDFLAAVAASPQGAQFYIFPSSATQCFSYREGTWKAEYDTLLTTEERQRITEAIHETIESADFLNGMPVVGERIIDRGAQIAFTITGRDAPQEMRRSWDPTGEKRAKVAALLRQKLPDFEVLTGGATTVDITRPGMDKSESVRWLSKKFGLSPSDMLYIGDALHEGGNDSVVIPTGIQAKQVASVAETAAILQSLLEACRAL